MRNGRVVAAAALLALVLGGCDDANPAPAPLPTETSSPPTSSTTPTPPVMPARAEEPTAAGAKAFVAYYFQVLNYAISNGDTRKLRALAAKACVSCNALAGNVERIYQAGGWIQSEGWRVRNLQALGQEVGGRYSVSASLRLTRERVKARADSAVQTHPGASHVMLAKLRRAPSTWVIQALDLVR